MKNESSLAIFLWSCHLNTTACKKEYRHPYAFCQPAWQMQRGLCASSKYTEKMIYKASSCSDFWREGITQKKMYHLHIDQHIQSLQLGAFFFFISILQTLKPNKIYFWVIGNQRSCDLHPSICAVWLLSQGAHTLSGLAVPAVSPPYNSWVSNKTRTKVTEMLAVLGHKHSLNLQGKVPHTDCFYFHYLSVTSQFDYKAEFIF